MCRFGSLVTKIYFAPKGTYKGTNKGSYRGKYKGRHIVPLNFQIRKQTHSELQSLKVETRRELYCNKAPLENDYAARKGKIREI